MYNEIQYVINKRVHECMAIVREKFNLTTFEDPDVYFDIKGTSGGCAVYSDWSVHFNLELARLNLEEYLYQVVPHEIAHLVDFKVYNNRGHKKTWKMIMKYVFGLSPDRCHEFDTSEVKKKKYDTYIYTCKCPGEQYKFKSNMHKKIQSGRNFRCNKCVTRIVFKEYFGKT